MFDYGDVINGIRLLLIAQFCTQGIKVNNSIEEPEFHANVAKTISWIFVNQKKSCPRVVINREPVGIFNDFSFFNDDDCGRDIFYPSSCDEAAVLMANALGTEVS